MAQPSPTPVRFPAGLSTDFPFGPLAAYANPSPFRYQSWADDFNTLGATYPYTLTVTNAGTIAQAAGAGGTALFTTDALAADLCSMQLPFAGFAFTLGKRAFFLARLQVSSAANAEFNVGLIQTTTTPFTVTNGIYFRKPTGAATGLVLNVTSASATVSTTIPTAVYTLANATYIDLGWQVTRAGDVIAFVGSDLVTWQSQNTAALGPVARATLPTLPAGNTNFTLAVKGGTASVKTMTVDFALAAVER